METRIIAIVLIAGVLSTTMFFYVGNYGKTFAQSNSTNQTMSKQSKFGLFQGNHVKLFALSGIYNVDQWKPIDDASSQGYHIKSVVPAKDRTVVIMEKTP